MTASAIMPRMRSASMGKPTCEKSLIAAAKKPRASVENMLRSLNSGLPRSLKVIVATCARRQHERDLARLGSVPAERARGRRKADPRGSLPLGQALEYEEHALPQLVL